MSFHMGLLAISLLGLVMSFDVTPPSLWLIAFNGFNTGYFFSRVVNRESQRHEAHRG